MEKELNYQDYLDRINIQDALLHAGYRLNRRDGRRWPSYVRVDDQGQRVHGDKFLVSTNGKTCFRPGVQGSYNVISLIKAIPNMFPESSKTRNLDHLVNEVCRNILNVPQQQRDQRIVNPRRDIKPYDIRDYEIRKLDPDEKQGYKAFYPFFKSRGIDMSTQKAFADHFVLAKKIKQNQESKPFWNLSFPLVIPGREGIVGMEERGRARLDGKSGYKGKAEGSNGSEGLWVAKLGKGSLKDAEHVYWFESAYDAMAYYQLNARKNPDLRQAVFVSSGGNLTVGQIRGMLSQTPGAVHHLCFDNDRAGWDFSSNFRHEHVQMLRSRIVRTNENKAYLDSLFGATDLTQGDARLLPKNLQIKYAEYKEARDEYMAMQGGSLDPKGEKAVLYARQRSENLLEHFSIGLRKFLKVSEAFPEGEPRTERELPERGKDWNDLLLLERGTQKDEGEDEDRDDSRTRSRFVGIDIDGDGEIEPDETHEVKEQMHRQRR